MPKFEADKLKHYKYCYRLTSKRPNWAWGLGVFLSVSIYKELIHDLILRRGRPEWADVRANWHGVKDAVNSGRKKQKRSNESGRK